jgi:hypothetical protein
MRNRPALALAVCAMLVAPYVAKGRIQAHQVGNWRSDPYLAFYHVAAYLTYSNPYEYCRAVGTIDHPDNRYVGPKEPPGMRKYLEGDADYAEVVWRCMDGSVYACYYSNQPICDKPNASEINRGVKEFCRENPNSDYIPTTYAGSNALINWACRNGKPHINGGDTRFDKRGYQTEFWKWIAVPPSE